MRINRQTLNYLIESEVNKQLAIKKPKSFKHRMLNESKQDELLEIVDSLIRMYDMSDDIDISLYQGEHYITNGTSLRQRLITDIKKRFDYFSEEPFKLLFEFEDLDMLDELLNMRSFIDNCEKIVQKYNCTINVYKESSLNYINKGTHNYNNISPEDWPYFEVEGSDLTMVLKASTEILKVLVNAL